MNSLEIQTAVEQWAISGKYDAPYGVLTNEHTNKKGTRYLTVTFGRARTLDATVEIYNRNFMIVRTSRHGSQTFKNYADLQQFLNTL